MIEPYLLKGACELPGGLRKTPLDGLATKAHLLFQPPSVAYDHH
jgi:hypothetical protein